MIGGQSRGNIFYYRDKIDDSRANSVAGIICVCLARRVFVSLSEKRETVLSCWQAADPSFLPPVPIRLALLNKRTAATRFRKWGALLAPSHHPLLNPFVMLHQTISATLASSTKQRFFLMDAEKRKKQKQTVSLPHTPFLYTFFLFIFTLRGLLFFQPTQSDGLCGSRLFFNRVLSEILFVYLVV